MRWKEVWDGEEWVVLEKKMVGYVGIDEVRV